MDDIIAALQKTKAYIHLTTSGAGSMIQHQLWMQPGASSWLSGATFPYSQEETQDFLGFEPTRYVSEETAIHLACAAYMKACRFGQENPIGLGLTTSIASLHEHKGDHRIHAAVVTNNVCWSTTYILAKGVGFHQRALDDAVTADVAFKILGKVVGIAAETPYNFQNVSDQELLSLIMIKPVFLASGQRTSATVLPRQIALMPGAYNPPHEGHFGIASAAAEQFGRRIFHHVTIDSPHKPRLTAQEVLQRAKLLKHHDAIFTLGDSLYLQKAERFPGVPIVMGADALRRMLDPCWGQDPQIALKRFSELGTKFYVNARQENGVVKTVHDILNETGYDAWRDLFNEIPGSWNISSTEIRNALMQNK